MFIPPGYGNLQWTFRTINGQDALTAMGVRLEAADPPTVLAGAVAAFEDNLSAFVQDGWRGEDVRLIVGTSDPSASLVYENGPWEGGSATADGLPPNVSTLIQKKTLLGGRHGRGRMYLPSPTEGGVDAYGVFSETQFDALVDAVTGFGTDLAGVDGVAELVLLHTDDDVEPTDLTGLFPSRSVVTQRRRLR